MRADLCWPWREADTVVHSVLAELVRDEAYRALYRTEAILGNTNRNGGDIPQSIMISQIQNILAHP